MSELDEYWNKFLKDTNRDSEDKCSGDLFFEADGFISSELIALVLSGRKTALFTPLANFLIDQAPLPLCGEEYIVVDNNDKPQCIIEIDSVEIVPFNEVTWEMADLEGESQNLGEWKEKETEYLEEEAHFMGFDFTPDLKLVFQTFKVIYN